jgi:hypothetical protein
METMRAAVAVLLLVACSDDTQGYPDAALPDARIDAPVDAATDAAIDAHPGLTEPYVNLPRIFAGAKAYWEQLPDGSTKQFPASQPLTTSPSLCCVFLGGACTPSPLYWTSPTWTALQFHIDVPFFYWYDFQSQGTDATATFAAHAYGDLNCDTVTSTYELHGSVDADGGVVGGTITATRPNE